MATDRTRDALRRLRTDRGMSLRQLAAQTHCDHSWLANIEVGRRWPGDRNWVEQADLALDADGAIVAAWDGDQREQAVAAETVRLLD
ncbi:MAG: helix-turn-helix domain-containing protein [Haloechinothrix sp.]